MCARDGSVGYRESFMECLHPGTCRVAGSSHSDGELWHNFVGKKLTQLPLSTQKYKRVHGH